MEKETNLYKRVDLFFLVDSITQCSRNQKGKLYALLKIFSLSLYEYKSSIL
jgi:hypothetical protein